MKPVLLLKACRNSSVLFVLCILLLSSCSVEKHFGISADRASQKKATSSGGSSQKADPAYKANFHSELVIWLLDVRVSLDEMESARELDSFELPADKNKLNSHLSFWLRPEFIQKGSRFKFGSSKLVSTFNYIELPASIRYGNRMADNSYWTAGLGPYIAYGLGGNTKSTINGQTTKAKVFTAGGYKRFDAGITIGGSYGFPVGLSLGLNYDLGLVNIQSTNAVTTKNRSLSLDVSYSIAKFFHHPEKKKK
jgi:hypothetical protein